MKSTIETQESNLWQTTDQNTAFAFFKLTIKKVINSNVHTLFKNRINIVYVIII